MTYPDIQLFQDNITATFVNINSTNITIACEVSIIFSCTLLPCISSNFCPKIHNLECLDRSYQFIEYVQSTIPSGITFNNTIDRVVDSCSKNGYYSFGPFDKRFIGNMTVVPAITPEKIVGNSQIRICTE